MLKLTPKQLARKQEFKPVFRKIGSVLSDYHTGKESHFRIKSKIIQDPAVSSRECGPVMKSQQFERTAKE